MARYGHLACFAGAISWKLGRRITFDPVKEAFANDDEANAMRTCQHRTPYTIQDVTAERGRSRKTKDANRPG
jgi:hypothetical protein